MSEQDEQYWQLVERLIDEANAASEQQGEGASASALINAAARYAAFYVAGSAEDRKALKEDKDTLIQDIAREFKARFAENLEDYIENYKNYFREE